MKTYNKTIYSFFILIGIAIIFLIFGSKKSYAQECGIAGVEGLPNRCCTVNISEGIKDNGFLDFLPCLSIPIISVRYCVGDLFKSSTTKVQDLLPTQEINQSIACKTGRPSTAINDASCICLAEGQLSGNANAYLCDRYLVRNKKPSQDYKSCLSCFAKEGFWTGLGCFYIGDWKTFIEKNVFGFVLGLAGIFAFFCIIYSAFLMQISSGNPEKVKNAQSMFTSCIAGLILIIFSVIILRIIGIDILRIPGFN